MYNAGLVLVGENRHEREACQLEECGRGGLSPEGGLDASGTAQLNVVGPADLASDRIQAGMTPLGTAGRAHVMCVVHRRVSPFCPTSPPSRPPPVYIMPMLVDSLTPSHSHLPRLPSINIDSISTPVRSWLKYTKYHKYLYQQVLDSVMPRASGGPHPQVSHVSGGVNKHAAAMSIG
ncbi:hypothetical protein BD779DRAFT_1474690 [Infundibulicybe gibba]|nr:hypothetical protein BD779DRAFT_1474690 [Infundibulicybe gibba]